MIKHLKKMTYDTECQRVNHLVELFNNNDFESIDFVIKKIKDLSVFVWDLQYIYLV